MNHTFQVAAGSVIGRHHRQGGHNNQDALHTVQTQDCLVAIVCDGCGSRPYSEVGANLLARLAATTIARQHEAAIAGDWQTIRCTLLDKLQQVLAALDEEANIEAIVRDYFLSTLIGAVITPDQTVLFAIGDGVLWLNGCPLTLDKPEQNTPPYLGYGLLERLDTTMGRREVAPRWAALSQVRIYHHGPTSEVNSMLIGSDGVADLIAAKERPLPGKVDRVGDISQFWYHDLFFQNPDRVRRYLTLVNRDSTQPDWQHQQIKKSLGLLPDDTTLVAIRRISA